MLGEIRRHAEATYPEECCGALLGRIEEDCRRVSHTLPMDNARQEERERRFFLRAADYQLAERLALQRGLDLIGFYHSHPDHTARPSAYDLEHALPWHSYVVLAVEKGLAGEWASWVLASDRSRFESEPGCSGAAHHRELGAWTE